MKLHIFISPADLLAIQPSARDIFIVIDVIRATTAITTIFDRGAARILIANTVEQARTAATRVPGRLLCGERNVHPLPGFDYGNSPAEFLRANFTERELILTTTNGTRAFFACPEQSIRLAGCFYNAEAVTAHALQSAQKSGGNIAIVCAAEHGYFALDDTVCAGYLAREILRRARDIEYHESVTAAMTLLEKYPPAILPKYCNSARQVIDSGLKDDIDLCMRTSISTSIAQATGREDGTGLLILEKIG